MIPTLRTLRHLFVFLFFLLSILSNAQVTTIKGRVTTQDKAPAVGANIYLRDTYDGATSDPDGNFSFETEETGEQTLMAIYLGYDTIVQKVTLRGGVVEFNPVLKEGFNELKVVVISAGAFEASDEKKVTVLKPLDIVTTASANGDTYGALKTLPGTQVSSGDQEGLFVRGGSGSEAPTFIDGLLVRNPFSASTPDYAARGRFNPFLFKGTVFSTGGYSAQYGQGMSSALILDSQDLPDRSAGTLALSSVGLGFGHLKLWKEKGRAAGININYTNLAPYFWIANPKPNFTHKPEAIGAETFFRQKTRGKGMLKFYGYYNRGRVAFETDAPGGGGEKFGFDVRNNNVYTNLSWSGLVGSRWKLNGGLSYSYDWNDIASSYNTGFIAPDTFGFQNSLAQGRLVATRFFGRLTSLRFGGEYQYSTDIFKSRAFGDSRIEDNYSAVFAETDWYLTTRLVARVGLRGENSALLDEARLSPRVSLAYKIGRGDQFSFAWGYFYQKGDSLLRWRNEFGALPGFQRAEHFILNYQYILNDRTFRIESYYKNYDRLVTTEGALRNDGDGYARGIELFYRDKKTIPAVDFWVSYSWLDTRRKFQWYPVEAQPVFAASHVFTLVGKKFFPKIRTGAGFTYSYATGRPYYNPNRPVSEFLTDRTPDYHNLSINLNYLTTIKGAFTVFVVGLQNVLGNQQIFGYRYSPDGSSREALTPAVKQFFFIGAFASWGVDRRQEVIDNQN